MNDTPARLRSIASLRRVRDGLDPEQVADLLAGQAQEIQQLRRALDDAQDDARQARTAPRAQQPSQDAATGQTPPGRSPSPLTQHRSVASGHHNPFPGRS